jgi:CBS domain-containing protein
LGQLHFVVLSAQEQLRCMVRVDDLELPEDDPYLRNLILVTDLYIEEVEPIDAEDNLHLAMEKLLDSGFDKLPVVRRDEQPVFMGYLMYQDILQAYDDEVERLNREV